MHWILIGVVKENINWNQETNYLPEKECILSRDKDKPVYLVSADQFLVNTPGLFTTGYGRESYFYRSHGGTLNNDSTTSIIWDENKVSLGASETVLGKERFEQWIWG